MKFKGSIDINKPLETVVSLFSNPDHLKEWQEGFVKKELVSGTDGEAGAISKIYFQQGKRHMELTETIVSNKLPDYLEESYHHKHMDNTLTSKFTALDQNTTRYTTEGEYTAFRGFIPKLMAFFFPKVFEKQAQKWLDNFKEFAESTTE